MRNIISLCEQDLLGQLEQKDDELTSEKKNAVKRDKTIQGLTQLLKEKEKEVSRFSSVFLHKLECCLICGSKQLILNVGTF